MAEASARLDDVDNGTLTMEETRARAEVARKKEEAAACAVALKSSTGGKGVDESCDSDDADSSDSSNDTDLDSDNSDAVSKRKAPCRSEVSSARSSTGHAAKRHKGPTPSTPKKEEEATPGKRNAPPAVGHITISTARDMHRKLTSFANNFANGLYDQTTGRRLQHLQK